MNINCLRPRGRCATTNALLLRNIQLTEENSLPGIFMTLIVRMLDLKSFFWLPFY